MSTALDMHDIVGTHDIVLLSLDTLRHDAAQGEFLAGRLPVLSTLLPPDGFETRQTPGSFTYAAHQAFFAGFLPTPAQPGPHPRLFALSFEGSETTDSNTFVFNDSANIVEGLAAQGYRTICIGGVGFFNLRNPLGRVLPELFEERHWEPGFGVTAADSTERQVALACTRLAALPDQRVFLFMNISALHQPNRHYLPGAQVDDLNSHRAALRYVDGALAPLLDALRRRGPCLLIVLSDHGTAYGEDGWYGHRHAHPVVLTVPYAQAVLA
jgi:hypothetical protein